MLNHYDPFDVMTALEVEVQFDEDAFCEFYVVKRHGLTLDVTFPLSEPRAEITLRQEGMTHPVMKFSFWAGGIRRVMGGRGEMLEFFDCILGNVGFNAEDVAKNSNLTTCSIFLWVKPQISIQIA